MFERGYSYHYVTWKAACKVTWLMILYQSCGNWCLVCHRALCSVRFFLLSTLHLLAAFSVNTALHYHLYADDTQMYPSFDMKDCDNACKRLEDCISEIRDWMAGNFLCLNDDKTEIRVLGSKHITSKLGSLSLKIGSNNILSSTSAKNIGAIFDNNMTMHQHVNNISRGEWHQLWNIGLIENILINQPQKKSYIPSFPHS